MMSPRDTNLRLAELLGVETAFCTGFDLHVQVGEIPSLTVHKMVIEPGSVSEEIGAFVLSVPDTRFNLDRACELAMKRVTRVIDAAAARALAELRRPIRSYRVAE